MSELKAIIPVDGAFIKVPEGTDYNEMKRLWEATKSDFPDRKFIIINSDVNMLDEKTMNSLGWFRKETSK